MINNRVFNELIGIKDLVTNMELDVSDENSYQISVPWDEDDLDTIQEKKRIVLEFLHYRVHEIESDL